MNKLPVYIFGEVLFDCFEEAEPVLGGAPFNVAWHLQGFGEQPCFISAVGDDAAGQRVRKAMQEWNLSEDFIQTSPSHPTGIVNVKITGNEPSYDIQADCAYDYIQQDAIPNLKKKSLIYHGTLAMRSPVSEASLKTITHNQNHTLFIDVNLRPPWWDFDKVTAAINCAEYVKLNIDELKLLSNSNIPGVTNHDSMEWCETAAAFKLEHDIVNLIVTRGELGATFFDANGEIVSLDVPPLSMPLTDTVGAGDAFAAVVILGILNEWSWHTTLDRAQQFSSFIVTRHGALCTDLSIYDDFSNFWNIDISQ